ncbi:DUF418 domain-containing protein [Pseudoalteromonas sp. OOF1S-7]|uniref:DUF418 domain-containing protein n=1 Tax=Pseudoalteromonas sp. OOF1S-7 TaxID=2917757 RepID=UPI001EF40DD5|nr:DUF418 domain-containing protein [Pseudoalteromonas sp. OOF1S-7]MCG7533982.1 DUF418 domain-containing protein [Pseudoalteromonas sp. OOF1S-7]
MANFAYGYVPPVSQNWLESGLSLATTMFADGRFRTLFCLVFGAALLIQYKQQKTNDDALFQIKSRLCVLAVFGVLHGYLLWPGDILLNYALSGLLALLWLNAKNRLFAAAILTILPVGLLVILSALVREPNIDRASAEYATLLNSMPVSYADLLSQNISHFNMMIILIPLATLWNTLGLMLLGMELYERGWLSGQHTLPAQWLWTLWWGSAFVSLLLWLSQDTTAGQVLETMNWLAAMPMALCYLMLLQALGTQLPRFSKVLAIVGRYSLSLYLFQSLIGIGVFHFIFPAARVSFTRLEYFEFFLTLTLSQVILAILLNRAKRTGPAEFILKRCVRHLSRL